ncbi:MAG: CrcB family protein [Deltaproteobacteria bacterium]|nr:CrcB family protein [Deltaproteobacteria bacterium]
MTNGLAIFIGGGLGSLARWMMVAKFHPPLGTLLVNWLGSLVIGYLAQKLAGEHLWISLFCIGILGGFTTFSAFSWDVLKLSGTNFEWKALTYILASVIGAIALCFLGRNLAIKF